MKHDITFLVFAFNEERRIEHYLRCVQEHGEIVVIDNFSKDKTIEIARKYTENIFQHQNPGSVDNDVSMSFALDKVKTKWVYLGLVDELIPHELMQELHKIAKSERYKIVEISRKDFMYGQEVFNYSAKHVLRMFIPGTVDFKDNIVHKLGRYTVSEDQVYKVPKTDTTSIWHFSSYNTSRIENSHNRYADLEAKQRHEIAKQQFSGARALFKLVFFFLGTYLGRGGFRGGWPGFFISVQIAYFKFSIEARLWEYDNRLSMAEIEHRYDCLKEELINPQNQKT